MTFKSYQVVVEELEEEDGNYDYEEEKMNSEDLFSFSEENDNDNVNYNNNDNDNDDNNNSNSISDSDDSEDVTIGDYVIGQDNVSQGCKNKKSILDKERIRDIIKNRKKHNKSTFICGISKKRNGKKSFPRW
ncbi:late transcription factor, putative [Trichomonas vaginalis G3]|uniref:Late transcription factor, putative n=1 Tax=Trichomonas vaginalis (strain ATCC PRA-98 / G3) TaxID=412133 RepID=A2GFG5_TRIV3|nr:hypothetical protein TVAGG3_0328940 [Trichomonas vaginalis G3]EAX84103.1 late transcription factor, putative [Trichomonas vaginalis G3]KAI5529819.1 hypothetical protein TVAGG3_0328940 [Trichomonas vaginalis G3]|eukprot:XP_001297033.1 late transcription factor [Trichomonas vaginalis G3]